MNGPTQSFANYCSEGRTEAKKLGEKLKNIIANAKAQPEFDGMDKSEMIANATLAYRHCEDVALRLGKAIQAFEGGKSIYDSNDAARVAANGPVDAGAYSSGGEVK